MSGIGTRFGGVKERLRTANPDVIDAAVAIAVAIPLSVPFVTDRENVTALGVIVNLGTVVPLFWRRRWPGVVALTVFLFAGLVSWYHQPRQMLQYAGLVALYSVASRGRPWQRHLMLGIVLVTFPPASLLLKHNTAAEFMFTVGLPIGAFLLGTVARTSRERADALADYARELERVHEIEAARARAEERTRIARDMHDILAHAVSVMVVQAEAGPVVIRTDPDRAERTFDAIADAGRSAMTQLSRVLGVLRDADDACDARRMPTAAGIDDLVNDVRRAGVPIELQTEGRPRALAPEVDAAAYRLVQEALTNTLKHAVADAASVRLDWHQDLVITVTNTGPPVAAARVPSGGHGLDGLRERVLACGGSVEAGPTATGFRVRARLSIPAAA